MRHTAARTRKGFPWRSSAQAAAAALLLVLLAACGNNPHPDPLHTTRPDGSPWITYHASIPQDIRSLDPQVTYDEISRIVLENVQDTLLEYDIMKTDPYEVQPCLLEAMPEQTENADGSRALLCRLKRGIFYHDDPCFPGGRGRELVAEDVHFAFQRLCDPAVETPVFANFAEYVPGMQQAHDAAKQNGGKLNYDTMKVSGLEVIDSHTFRLHLSKPYPQILYWLAMHFTAPVAREAAEYYDGQAHPDGPGGRMVTRPLFQFHPVGNGPFRIVEYVRGQRFRLVRNEKYHTTTFPTGGWPAEREAINRPLAGRPLPLIDELQITIFQEILPIWLLTRQGYLDRMGVQKDAVNSVVTTNAELTPKYAKRGLKLEKALEPSTFFMSINMQDPLLGKNKKLRQALSCSYNPQGYIDMLYGGVAPVAQQILSPGVFGYDKDYRNPYGFNLEKARQLMAEAGYPGGRDPATGQPLEITMDVVATGGEERQLAEYEQRQLEQTGIKVRIIENTFARLLEKEDQGNFQIAAGTGWGADYPDPENFFFLFTSSNFPPTGKNICRFSNAEFDALFDKMATMESTPERLEIARRMNDILMEERPIIMHFHKAYYLITQPWAPRTHENMMVARGLGFKYLPCDTVLREQKRREWNQPATWPIPLAIGVVALGLFYGIRVNRQRNI